MGAAVRLRWVKRKGKFACMQLLFYFKTHSPNLISETKIRQDECSLARKAGGARVRKKVSLLLFKVYNSTNSD